jgi:hypothetical protein
MSDEQSNRTTTQKRTSPEFERANWTDHQQHPAVKPTLPQSINPAANPKEWLRYHNKISRHHGPNHNKISLLNLLYR